MPLINKVFGFSTKDLYLVELVRYEYEESKELVTWYRSNPRKCIIARKKGDNFPVFIDVFTKSSYRDYESNLLKVKDEEVVAKIISPFISNKRRIKYKDAEKILYTKNTTYIEKK